MCGIAGAVNCRDRGVLEAMSSIQAYRGPDDQGVWTSDLDNGGWIGLTSRRLAILDLSPAGHMPMFTDDGALTIVYNGEIYNYPQLRRELEAKGYRFHSNSDTESLLYLYQEDGPDFVKRLNGMFAIALWDAPRRQLFLARDHFGIKPLYYYHNANALAFASEIKALLQLKEIPRRLNPQALLQYLTFLWTPDPLTMFDGIFKLMPGHYAIFHEGNLQISQYWDLDLPSYDHVFAKSEADLVDELCARWNETVKAQMLSDVPLGAFLSAGLDSSSIVAAMANTTNREIRTFTIAFPDKYRRGEVTLDDTEVARRTAAHFGCNHTEIIVEPDVVDLLPKLVWHMDEPTADPAIITAFLVNREARKNVTVLLSGAGGDEVFAGYRKYQAQGLAQRYARLPKPVRAGIVEPVVRSLPSMRGTPVKGYVRLAKKMVRSASMPPRERFLDASVYLTEAQKAQLYNCYDDYRSDPFVQHSSYFDRVSDADFLNQMMYVDLKTFLVSLNLCYNDKMSMASSVEVRVPFIDKDFVEWAFWNIPPSLKLRDGTTKYILREAMRPTLPAEVLTQKKAGFGAPADYWLAQDLREMVDDLLSEGNLNARGLFDAKAVRAMIDEQRKGREDWTYQIWQFLTLELWMRAFLD